ncbi:DUF2971 domain-containing protein [Agromyces sp. NPDC056523]|uniref:DUF2971 domain-containing protein n=1 Tax=Agromyces sp. NPDC056523 TaxID=3345850 RepID=UPI0036703FE9
MPELLPFEDPSHALYLGDDGFEVALPPEVLVWHYTQHKTLKTIISSHILRASDIRSMNDRNELHQGIKRVRQAFKKLKRDWDYREGGPEIGFDELEEELDVAADDAFDGSAFVTSFSRTKDSTDQWKAYAKPDGFAIGIPRDVRLPVLGSEPSEYSRGRYIEEIPLRWISLRYGKADQIAHADEGLGRVMSELGEAAYISAKHDDIDFGSIFRDRAKSLYVDSVAAIKHKAFKSEREVRYAVTRPTNPAAIKTLPGTGRMYIELTGALPDPFDRHWQPNEPEYYQPTPANLPIRAICIGPGNSFERTKAEVERWLSTAGYSGVEIIRSKSPLR